MKTLELDIQDKHVISNLSEGGLLGRLLDNIKIDLAYKFLDTKELDTQERESLHALVLAVDLLEAKIMECVNESKDGEVDNEY